MLTFLLPLLARLFLLDTDGTGATVSPDGHDDTDDSDATDRAKGDEPPALTEEEIRNPRLKELHDEAGKYRRRLRKAEGVIKERDTRIAELEANPPDDVLRSARLEVAFLRAVMASDDRRWVDLETAWELATSKGFFDAVNVSDDGQVDTDALTSALDRLIERYGYLVDLEESPKPSAKPTGPSGPKLNKGRQSAVAAASRQSLEQRFPALRRGRA